MPMNKLGLDTDSRCEAQRIRIVDRDDPHFRSISTLQVDARDGVQEPCTLPKGCIALTDCDELLSTGICFYDEGYAARFYPTWFVVLKPMDVERWKCAATLLRENPRSGIWTEYDGLLNNYTSDWPPLSQRGATLGVSIWVLFVCAGLLYGGLHALPWNSEFRTKQEKVPWRASVGMVIGFGPVAMAAYLAKVVFIQVRKNRELRELPKSGNARSWWHIPEESIPFSIFKPFRRMAKLLFWLGSLVGSFAVVAICLGYCLARIFIVVECFIALFHSEPGFFEAPSWSVHFPHIT